MSNSGSFLGPTSRHLVLINLTFNIIKYYKCKQCMKALKNHGQALCVIESVVTFIRWSRYLGNVVFFSRESLISCTKYEKMIEQLLNLPNFI